MSFDRIKTINSAEILGRCLPDLQMISEALSSPPLKSTVDSAVRARAEDVFLQEENRKFYKACDRFGNVYLMKNPITNARLIRTTEHGERMEFVQRFELVRVFDYEKGNLICCNSQFLSKHGISEHVGWGRERKQDVREIRL